MEDNKPGGAPPDSPSKPKPISNEKEVSFSFRELDLQEVLLVDGYKMLSFMVRGEFVVLIREFDYFNLLSYIFGQIEFIQSDEDGQGCTCDNITPSTILIEDNHKIQVQRIDTDTNEVVEEGEKFIKVYEAYDLVSNTIVGACNIKQ